MPNTVNIALQVPTTGSLVGTWGSSAMNPNFVSIDGQIAGVQIVSVSNAPVTLTAPAGALTPGAGPTQSENRVLVFTGALTANVQITLPLPALYEVFNNTTGNFVLSFRAATLGKIVSVPQGGIMTIYNNGTDCFLAKNLPPGTLLFISAETALPAWAAACTTLPMLLADGSIYNVADYPAIGNKFGSSFGGNGITTFGVQDLRGRVPLAYDGTGTRITVAGGAGFNGQTMGAVGGNQGSILINANNTPYTPAGSVSTSGTLTGSSTTNQYSVVNFTGTVVVPSISGGAAGANIPVSVSGSMSGSLTGTPQGGASAVFSNTPPAQVSGSWFVVT